jgi:hypothetical protein
MIHINYPNGQKPPDEWLTKAKILTDRLRAAPDRAARNKIIDENSHLWGEIKTWLEGFSYGKCWFSEARDTYSHLQVEHFRPKKQAKEPDREGYWWRAFDYLNYRLCGSVGNSKKGSYFPLRLGTQPANCPEDDCDLEHSVLIDPTRKNDADLITFSNGGVAVPAEADGWDRERAEKSIERYKLNEHPALCRAREDVWSRCKLYVDELELVVNERRKAEKADKCSAVRNEKIEKLKVTLEEMTSRKAPFSAVARAFLFQDNRDWVRRCVA